MNKTTKSVTVTLDGEGYDALRDFAIRNDLTMAQVLRRALDAHIRPLRVVVNWKHGDFAKTKETT